LPIGHSKESGFNHIIESCLDIADGKSADKSVMFTFEPVVVDSAQQIDDVTST